MQAGVSVYLLEEGIWQQQQQQELHSESCRQEQIKMVPEFVHVQVQGQRSRESDEGDVEELWCCCKFVLQQGCDARGMCV
jgi:hypothetical protein